MIQPLAIEHHYPCMSRNLSTRMHAIVAFHALYLVGCPQPSSPDATGTDSSGTDETAVASTSGGEPTSGGRTSSGGETSSSGRPTSGGLATSGAETGSGPATTGEGTTTDGTSSGGDTTGGETTGGSDSSTGDATAAETGSGPLPPWEPTNIRGDNEEACHVAGELPDDYVYATCVGDEIPIVEEADDFCMDGPRPFGAMSLQESDDDPWLHYCNLQDDAATWFVFGDNFAHALVVAYPGEDGDTAVDAIGLTHGESFHYYRCRADGSLGSENIDFENPYPVGEQSCGALTIVWAEPGQPPLVRADVWPGAPVYLQMVSLP